MYDRPLRVIIALLLSCGNLEVLIAARLPEIIAFVSISVTSLRLRFSRNWIEPNWTFSRVTSEAFSMSERFVKSVVLPSKLSAIGIAVTVRFHDWETIIRLSEIENVMLNDCVAVIVGGVNVNRVVFVAFSWESTYQKPDNWSPTSGSDSVTVNVCVSSSAITGVRSCGVKELISGGLLTIFANVLVVLETFVVFMFPKSSTVLIVIV